MRDGSMLAASCLGGQCEDSACLRCRDTNGLSNAMQRISRIVNSLPTGHGMEGPAIALTILKTRWVQLAASLLVVMKGTWVALENRNSRCHVIGAGYSFVTERRSHLHSVERQCTRVGAGSMPIVRVRASNSERSILLEVCSRSG
jgi:hypothetical protein